MAQGRPRRNLLSFADARQFVRDECISHRAEYFRWYDYNRPAQIPKYPRTAYKDEWKGWNDWLGNNNTFKGVKRNFRPFSEAVAFVHKLHLKSAQAWFQYIREHGIPDDIPSRPELVYRKRGDWVSWPHWLGNTLSTRVAGVQEIVKQAGLLYIVHIPGRPANVFKIGVELGGASAIRDAQAKVGFTVIKLFKMEPQYDWKALVLQHAKPWWENDAEFLVDNVNALMFDLGNDLLFA